MGRPSLDPVEHIVSFRVNAEEKRLLERTAGELGLSVSTLLRRFFRLGYVPVPAPRRTDGK